MEIVDVQEKIKMVATRWCDQYANYTSGGGGVEDKNKKEEILLKLYRLDKKTATKKDIENIIGNTSWVDFLCDECGNTIEKGVKFMDWDDSPNYMKPIICKDCLEEALEKLND